MFSSERARFPSSTHKTLTFLIRSCFILRRIMHSKTGLLMGLAQFMPHQTVLGGVLGKTMGRGHSGASFWLLQMGSALLSPARAARMVVATFFWWAWSSGGGTVGRSRVVETWRRISRQSAHPQLEPQRMQGKRTEKKIFLQRKDQLRSNIDESFFFLVPVIRFSELSSEL